MTFCEFLLGVRSCPRRSGQVCCACDREDARNAAEMRGAKRTGWLLLGLIGLGLIVIGARALFG